VLVAVIAILSSACGQPKDDEKPSSNPSSSAPETPETEDKVYGEGKTTFTLKVTFKDGSSETYTVNTDKKTVGEALMEHDLLAGEEGPYGLYVKTVAGETVDYDTDGKYWAFYIGGEYAMTGVDATEIEAGAEYELKVE
jgi:hypothetical protein